MSTLPVTSHPLHPPSLEELASILQRSLEANFREVAVTVETCPDLRQAPFCLAGFGLSGGERVADVGGQPNLFPQPNLDAKYSLLDIARAMEMSPEKGFLLGAGAGPFHRLGTNAELMPNLSWSQGFDNVDNKTHFAKIDRTEGVEKVLCALRSNHRLCSDGEPVR